MCQTVGLCARDRLRDTDHFFSGLFHTSKETHRATDTGWGQLAMEHFQVEP